MFIGQILCLNKKVGTNCYEPIYVPTECCISNSNLKLQLFFNYFNTVTNKPIVFII